MQRIFFRPSDLLLPMRLGFSACVRSVFGVIHHVLPNNLPCKGLFELYFHCLVSASSGKPSHKLPITVTYSTSPTGGWDPTCDAAAQSALDQKITDNDPGQTIVQLCNTFGFTEVSRKNSNHAITTSALSVSYSISFFLNASLTVPW